MKAAWRRRSGHASPIRSPASPEGTAETAKLAESQSSIQIINPQSSIINFAGLPVRIGPLAPGPVIMTSGPSRTNTPLDRSRRPGKDTQEESLHGGRLGRGARPDL